MLSKADDQAPEQWAKEKSGKTLNHVLSKKEVQEYIEAREYELYQAVNAKGDKATVEDMREALRQLDPKANVKHSDAVTALNNCTNEHANVSRAQSNEENATKALNTAKSKVSSLVLQYPKGAMACIEEFVEGRCNESTQRLLVHVIRVWLL